MSSPKAEDRRSKEAEAEHAGNPDDTTGLETCDNCGSDAVEWRLCKLVCRNCGTINKSCADL